MLRQTGKSIAVLMVILVPLACARLPGPIESDELAVSPGVKPVPAAWGNLIAVTDNGEFWYQLWFEDDQGAVRMVRYDRRNRSLLPEVELIPRQ